MSEVISIEQAYDRAGIDIKTGMKLVLRKEEHPREVSESDLKEWIREQRRQREMSLSRKEMVV